MLLCHKCEGLLGVSDPVLYSCECMSSYVSPWSTNASFNEALEIQINKASKSLEHYIWQGRKSTESVVVKKQKQLDKLLAAWRTEQ